MSSPMYNSTTSGQPQTQTTSTPHSSNRSSRASNTPASRAASQLQLENTYRENFVTDARNQGRGQTQVRGTHGHPPLSLYPVYPDLWDGPGIFPEQGPSSLSTGNPSRDAYPSTPAYGAAMLPAFPNGQTGEHREPGTYYTGFPPAATTNPLPAGGYSTYPIPLPPAMYPTQGDSAATWHCVCEITRAERDELHLAITLRRTPPST